jgi:hypothetical protein
MFREVLPLNMPHWVHPIAALTREKLAASGESGDISPSNLAKSRALELLILLSSMMPRKAKI